MKRWIFCLIAVISSFRVFSSVEMKCISVGANGDATITWVNTAGPAGFQAYYVYHSVTASGPFTLIDSILSHPTQTYTDLNSNANNIAAFYYISLKEISGTTISDTIQAIKLNVLNTGSGFADLNWNTTKTPLISTNSPLYRVYREYPKGVWTLLISLDMRNLPPNLSDMVMICADTLKYRVEVDDSSGCKSVSNIKGDLFKDVKPPATPIIDSVSVDASGNAVIGWNVNPNKDTYSYIILENVGTPTNPTWVVVDTVIGINNTFYASNINATTSPKQFGVLALDSCGNPSAISAVHRTIYLTKTFDQCKGNGSIQLSWTDYINSPVTPQYFVLSSENGGPYSVAGITAATNYTINGLKDDTAYCFKILAVLDGVSKTSTSNVVCITASLPLQPKFSYLKRVTVNSAADIQVEAYVDTAAAIQEYRLYRSVSPPGSFSLVAVIPNAKKPIIVFNDVNIGDADKVVYYYKVESVNICGNNTIPTQISHTIVPVAVANSNFTNSIAWNNYASWLGGVDSYSLFRDVDSIQNPVPIVNVLFGDSSYVDKNIADFVSSGGKFCYRVAAYEGSGNPYGFQDTSYSADVCVTQQSAIYIPNAFRITSNVNNSFNPSEAFVSLQNYNFRVYSRWGQLLFETSNPAEGWYGTYKDQFCPLGIYAWIIEAMASDGVPIKRAGIVTLIQ